MKEDKQQKIDIQRKKIVKSKSRLSLAVLNTAPELSLINQYGISPLLASRMAKKKPFRDLDSILELNRQKLSYTDFARLFSVLKTTTDFQKLECIESTTECTKDGYIYGTFTSQDKSIWVFINLPNINLIAAKLRTITQPTKQVMKERQKTINHKSIHIFGCHFMAMRYDLRTKKELTELLHSPIAKNAARLYEQEIPEKFDEDTSYALKELSKIVRFIQELTLPRFKSILTLDELTNVRKKEMYQLDLKADKRSIFNTKLTSQMILFSRKEQQDCETNGCSYSPDGHWKSCCDDHDICYCEGGTERDRLNCDKVFRDCLEKKAGFILAWIYYKAVREFGASHFNYFSAGADETFESSPIETDDCLVTFHLKTIMYKEEGDNIGNDIVVDFRVDVFCEGEYIGNGTFYRDYDASGKFDHHEKKNIYSTIFSKVVTRAQDKTFRFLVTAGIKEIDGGPDDENWYEYEHKNKQCGHTYWGWTEVYVSEWCEGTAEFRFEYDMTLQCVSG